MRDLLYQRPTYLSLLLLTVVSLGLLSFNTIGRQEDPTITNLFATVVTTFPGADPQRVEALVTEKIETELREISEIDTITSTSRTGISTVQIELSSFLADDRIEQVWSEIRDALDDAARTFPLGVAQPVFDNDRTGAFTAIAALTAMQDVDASRALLGRVAEDLQQRLRQIPQTKQVEIYGQPAEEVLVEIDPDKAASMGLTPAAIAAAIANADSKISAGGVRGPATDLIIEVSGEIDGLARVREIPLTSAAQERVARVSDVAKVSRGVRTPEADFAFADGQPAVLIAAKIENDRQVDVWAAAVRQELDDTRAALPEGLELALVFDQSAYTAERLGNVAQNLLIGVGLVVLVLFITMGWRSALIVGAILPLTSMVSLVVLERIGIVIHQMSVTGLVVALGLLVDAAIVMTDDIRQRLAAGRSPAEAIRAAVGRLAAPLVASTITTVLAFTPMAVLPGPAGDFVGAIALSVIVMLFASLLLALTVTPALAGRLLPAGAGRRRSFWNDGVASGVLGRLFKASLALSLRWRWLAMGAAATPAIVGFLAFPTLTAQFFPEVDRDQFYVQVELAEGSAITETKRAALDVDAVLRADPEITEVHWVVGRNAPAFYYNMLTNRDSDQRFAEALVSTVSEEATNRVIPRLQTTLDGLATDARVLVRGLKQGPPVDAPIELRLVGQDLETLRSLGEEVRSVMSEVPTIIHSRADLSSSAPKLVFELDEDKVRLAGLSLGDVAQQLETLADGALGGSFVEGPEELPVRVRVRDLDREAVDRLAALTIVPGNARIDNASFPGVPLAALGTISLQPSEGAIKRRGGERINTVQAYLVHGVLPDEGLSQFQARLAEAEIDLPPGYRIEFGGDTDARGETINNLLSVVGLVVVGSLAAIVLTFNSWRLSGVALIVCVLSAGLSLLALEIFRYPFGIQALIGVIGAIGVSINAAIIIMTSLQSDARASSGDPDAMVDVVLRSSRHIVSTTITTFGGFLPLILDGGGFWPPFATSIAGGVLLSAIVSFYFVPPAYSLVARRRPVAPPNAALAPA